MHSYPFFEISCVVTSSGNASFRHHGEKAKVQLLSLEDRTHL